VKIKAIASSSKGNCYLITKDGSSLLLECGISIKEIRKTLDFNLSSVAGCLCTHAHQDHSKAILGVAKSGVDVYTSEGTLEALGIVSHRTHAIVAHRQFDIDGWTILPFDTKHDAPEPLGFLIARGNEKLLYLTDSAYCHYRFKGITHFMVEVNYCEEILDRNISNGSLDRSLKKRLRRNHFSLETAVDFFKANDLSKTISIHLIHLSSGNSDEKVIKETIQRTTGKHVIVTQERIDKDQGLDKYEDEKGNNGR